MNVPFEQPLLLGEEENILISHRAIKRYPLHWHSYLELEIVIRGSGVHLLNGQRYPLSRGSTYLLLPTDFHAVQAQEEIELINISFREKILSEKTLSALLGTAGSNTLFLEDAQFERALMAMQLLQHECDIQGAHQATLLNYLVSFFLAAPTQTIPAMAPTGGIRRALLYMELHFREDLTLPLLARQAGFSDTYFSELFRKETGQTFVQKLTRLRLEYACVLLSNGCTAAQACYESGFNSQSNFYTAFRRRYGLSPGQYKEKNKAR